MIFEAVLRQIEKKLPFVIYQKPNSSLLIAFLQNNEVLENWKSFSRGFVIQPFDEGKTIFFEESNCEIIKENSAKYLINSINENEYKTNIKQQSFENLVVKTKDFLKQNSMDKIVVSTYEEVDILKNKLKIFQKIISKYSHAFCYWFYHPKVGEWMGATPELLMQKNNNQITTVSLAGTQIYQENMIWQEKEKEEQEFVTNYIQEKLKKYVEKIEIGAINTIKAGKLAHLKTIIQATLIDGSKLFEIVKDLHPTPAVCGLPKENALSFILKAENYNRAYYTGYLGEWNKDFENNETEKTQLFVNLRCMQIIKNQARIYVGCGITKDSIPENEYLEIVNKSKTMRTVL
ncbi:MAG: isochorismate synthase [Flavobacterium sp.]